MFKKDSIVVQAAITKILLTGWVKQQKFIFLSSRGWEKSSCQRIGFLVKTLIQVCGSLPPCWVLTQWRERERERALCPIRALIPFLKDPPVGHNYLPKTLPPNTITLGIRASALGLQNFRKTHLVHNIQ